MKKTIVLILIVLALIVPASAQDCPPGGCKIYLPVIPKKYVPNPNLIFNPSLENGEQDWKFQFPDSGGVVCDCDDRLCPEAQDGNCILRQGCWHNQTEYVRSNWFYMKAGVTYHFRHRWQVWSDEFSLVAEDRSLAYLIDERGRHRVYLSDLDNLPGDTTYWHRYDISIGMGESGWYALRIETTTDEEKPHRGLTCFYYDNFELRRWEEAQCVECVECQLYDEPPTTHCKTGSGEDCDGCCPDGDNCSVIDPECPVTKPPLPPYRIVGRYGICK
jgi:hypothetical protein